MQKAVREPLSTIVANAGRESGSIVDKVLANTDKNYGYDAMNDMYVNLIDAGIIDPTKVIRTALQVT